MGSWESFGLPWLFVNTFGEAVLNDDWMALIMSLSIINVLNYQVHFFDLQRVELSGISTC